MGLAFHYYHHWSHARAFEHTAAETQRLLGVRFGYGVYVNHLFAIVWTMDGALWLLAPQLHARRSRWLHRIVHGFLFFIAFNGAVIFEDRPVRWFGIFVTLLIAGLWLRRQLLVSTRVNSSPTMDAS